MPRRSGGRSAPAPQRRSAHTSARQAPPPVPHQQAPPPAAPMQNGQQRQPGLFANMASTAAGVAVGSTMGHGLSGMLFGGRGEPAPAPEAAPQAQASGNYSDPYRAHASCDVQAKQFTDCLNATNSDMSACGYYLEQLKACQAFQATM